MIEHLPETGSTNADLLARLAFGERIAEGQWLIADRQTAGRGRQGRPWQDGFGNFMGSTLVHLHPGDPPAPSLALLAGVALHRVVTGMTETAGAQLWLKWPNDLLLDGAKLAGILAERQTDSAAHVDCVVIGIGVNLAAAPALDDRATASLGITDGLPARNRFADHLAHAFAEALIAWRTLGIAPLLADWQNRAHPPGSAISVSQQDGTRLEGQFAGLEPDGALRLRLADDALRVMHAGEIALVGDQAGGAG